MDDLKLTGDPDILIGKIDKMYNLRLDAAASEAMQTGVPFCTTAFGRNFYRELRKSLLTVHSNDFVESVITTQQQRRKKNIENYRRIGQGPSMNAPISAFLGPSMNVPVPPAPGILLETEIVDLSRTSIVEPRMEEADPKSPLVAQLKQAFDDLDSHAHAISQYKTKIVRLSDEISQCEEALRQKEMANLETAEVIKKLQRQMNQSIDEKLQEIAKKKNPAIPDGTVVADSTSVQAPVAVTNEQPFTGTGAADTKKFRSK